MCRDATHSTARVSTPVPALTELPSSPGPEIPGKQYHLPTAFRRKIPFYHLSVHSLMKEYTYPFLLCWTRSHSIGFNDIVEISLGKTEKEATEGEMIGCNHRFNGHELEQALGDGEGQASLECCSHGVTKSWTQLRSWTTALLGMTWEGEEQCYTLSAPCEYIWVYANEVI